MNVVLYYDNEQNNCFIKNAVYKNRKFAEKLSASNITYTEKDISTTMNTNDLNLYTVDLNNVYTTDDIFKLVSDQAREKFKKGLKIVLHYSMEGHELDHWFLNLYNRLEKNKLLEYKIYCIHADLDFEENYKNFLKNNNLNSFLLPISVDFFRTEYFNEVNKFLTNADHVKTKDFVFYNGKLRPHRVFAVAELQKRNLVSNNFVSLADIQSLDFKFEMDKTIEILQQNDLYDEYLEDFCSNFKPIILDMKSDEFAMTNVYNSNLLHYTDTYFSVVSETSLTTRFITEKTYKPILNLHPFLLLSAPGMLTYLRSLGFKTFPELFDESYDNETDTIKRTQMVIDEVEKFSKLSITEKNDKFKKIKNKLFYNQQNYIDIVKQANHSDYYNILEKINEN